MRRHLPARKPPPSAPLPALPPMDESVSPSPRPPLSLQPVPDATPIAGPSTLPSPFDELPPPPQPSFSPSSVPKFALHPATPNFTLPKPRSSSGKKSRFPQNNRVAMLVDDVFGPSGSSSPPPLVPDVFSEMETDDTAYSGPSYPESPIRGPSFASRGP